MGESKKNNTSKKENESSEEKKKNSSNNNKKKETKKQNSNKTKIDTEKNKIQNNKKSVNNKKSEAKPKKKPTPSHAKKPTVDDKKKTANSKNSENNEKPKKNDQKNKDEEVLEFSKKEDTFGNKLDEEKKEKEKKEESKKSEEKEIKGKHTIKEEDKLKINKEKRKKKLEDLRKAKKRNKIIGICATCVLGIYLLGIALFSFICYPNTIIGDIDLSFQTQNAMKQSLVPAAGEYMLTTEGFGFELQIDGKSIDYNFDVDEVCSKVSELKRPFTWPVQIFLQHDFMTESVVSYNKETATSIAISAVDSHNTYAMPPQNANFVVDTPTRTVSIKEEVVGNTIDKEKTLNKILGCLGSARRTLALGEDVHLVPALYSTDQRIEAAKNDANLLLQSIISLYMATTNVSTIDFTLLASWLQLKEGYVAGLDDSSVTTWVANLADQCDTLGKSRTFTTPYGKTCTVSGGDSIGWQIDQPALVAQINDQATQGTVAKLSVPCSSTMGTYNGPGGRDWGPRYIDIDLSQQHVRMYDDAGSLVWEADCVSGKPGETTPTGIYTIKAKKSPTTLIGMPDPRTGEPSYRSRVEYWMGFVGDMVGLHDASWQSAFGGDRWLTNGSHGCINLPTAAAGALYNICVSGDLVVCHT